MPGEYICQEIVDGGKICGGKINPGNSTTPLWNHHKGKHQAKYRELKAKQKEQKEA